MVGKFEHFSVLPILTPFDGRNPRSVVVMDDIHHMDRVHEHAGYM